MKLNKEILKREAKIMELKMRCGRLQKALDLALYYVEGDATWEALKFQIETILKTGSQDKPE